MRLSRRAFLKWLGGLAGTGLAGYFYTFHYEVDKIEYKVVDLPVGGLDKALTGFTITQISDLHCDRPQDVERLGRAVDMINAKLSDLVVITGDYFSIGKTIKQHREACKRVLQGIKSKYGIISVMGNHDYWVPYLKLKEMLEEAGIRTLDNESYKLKVGGKVLTLVGVSSLWMKKIKVRKAFQGLSPKMPKILLAHNPDSALLAARYRPSVMLCGHTHGGQIRFPFYGSIINVARIGKKYMAGLNKYKDMLIYTNRGLGTFYIPARFNCAPEITRFRLKAI